MKLYKCTLRGGSGELDVAGAVTYAADREASHADGELERMQRRHDALETMFSTLLSAMIDNGVLRPEQVRDVFNGYVMVED